MRTSGIHSTECEHGCLSATGGPLFNSLLKPILCFGVERVQTPGKGEDTWKQEMHVELGRHWGTLKASLQEAEEKATQDTKAGSHGVLPVRRQGTGPVAFQAAVVTGRTRTLSCHS